MTTIALLAGLVAAFAVLGKAADILITHIKRIGERLGIGVFYLGLLLGLFTSFPELALGLNAFLNQATPLSLGNLLGGIPVLLGLVLGLSAILNKQVRTDGKNGSTAFILLYLLLPLLLGLDGQIGLIDGVVLILVYFLVIYSLYAWHRHEHGTFVRFFPRKIVMQDLFFTVFGIVLILLTSNIIVRITLALLSHFYIPEFIVGLLIYSIGTNLPEIVVTVRSWLRGVPELSMSHLLGSSMVNILILGMLAFLQAIPVHVGLEYAILVVMLLILLAGVYLFCRSDRKLSRREGWMLVLFYGIFVLTQAGSVFLGAW